jgi:CheY-like chemotaxis protein
MTAHILVVDDEPDVEALILQKFRHKIRGGAISFLFARDGVEALAALKANGQIDLVVTDINMPRMDGLLLLQKLQENEKQVSTIIVSAYGDMSNIRTAMNRGQSTVVARMLPKDIAARIEAIPIQTLTISDQQFLKGDASGTPTTIAGTLRVARGSGKLPLVILMHGSGGIEAAGSRIGDDR